MRLWSACVSRLRRVARLILAQRAMMLDWGGLECCLRGDLEGGMELDGGVGCG